MTYMSGLVRSGLSKAYVLLVCGLVFAGMASAAVAPATVRIHYNRTAGDYTGWQLYTWYGALNPSPQWNPAQPPDGTDTFGEFFDVPAITTDSGLNFILHDATGNVKNCPNDMYFPFPSGFAASGAEIWQLQDDCTIYTSQPARKVGDVHKARAHFVTRDTIAWPNADPSNTFRLYFSLTGGISSGESGVTGGQSLPLTVDASGLSPAVLAKFPALSGALALKIGSADVANVPSLLKGQLVVARFDATNALLDATALQIPGVLDDLYTYGGRLGALPGDGAGVNFNLWAPTAQSATLHVYDAATGPESAIVSMRFNPRTGVWNATGNGSWVNRKYYAYEVHVFVRSTGNVETNLVADPYSLGAAAGNGRSLIVDLDDDRTKPRDWDDQNRPPLAGPQDIVLYELHVRDFSASDLSVPAADRGKFRAFTYEQSDGMRHLKALQEAGLTHIHLLPSFEIASIPDNGCTTPVVPAAAPDSDAQQAAIGPTRDQDCFNWGYDPVLYTVPDGSYASNPNGVARIVEFRQMVEALHEAGLRVVMDVVYNHTTSSGQDNLSILDKLVPGYYYRLDQNGLVETSSCCQDTAAEHVMMGKLLTDSVLTWAREYKVDGFRFDIMSFHPKPLMVALKSQLAGIDPSIYIYGEGWNFGQVANNALFVQASQANMAGTGIGTFNDRMRDAVRGGGPFDGGTALVINQGYINGLWYDPNDLAAPATPAQQDTLNRDADWIRLGIAGTLKDYVFTDKDGNTKTGAQIDYFGQQAGYTLNPPDVINYISAHDNLDLFDNDQLKMPTEAPMSDRVRVNSLGIGLVLLSQGVPFFHAGDDILRSKSLDANSYNGGDWFNRIDFTFQSDNWGVGLPPAWDGNQGNWPVFQPFLANAALIPGYSDITQASKVFQDFLRIRKSSPLFRLRTGNDVKQRLKFYNVGLGQVPGLIVYAISDQPGSQLDSRYRSVVVVSNATKNSISYVVADYQGRRLNLHPVQIDGADSVVKTASFISDTGTFTVPARTIAVFAERRDHFNQP
jgi:pullulanase-type alpha-1,6-glucosidase